MTEAVHNTEQEEKPVEQRLSESAAKCLSCWDVWKKDAKNEEAREHLLESVHELRKVAARIEVDVAMAERLNANSKPIPIPEHKSKMENKKNQKPLSDILPVAEIKKANAAKKKINIEDADQEDTSDNDTNAPHKADQNVQEKPKARRGRRKKQESDNTDE